MKSPVAPGVPHVSRPEPAMRRRTFLVAATAALLPVPVLGGPGWDVRFFELCDDIEQARDELETLEASLEAGRDRLELVRHGKQYGVVLRLGVSEEEAVAAAATHDATLRQALDSDVAVAVAVEASSVERVFNVSYGLGPNLDALRADFDTVVRVLGEGVARDLVIEQTDHDNYALVYKRYGELDSTRAAARRHDALLRPHGVRAAIIQERAHRVVVDPSSEGEATRPEPPAAPPDAPAPEPAPAPAAAAALPPGRSVLRDTINDAIQRYRRAGRIAADERTSWLVFDIEADETLAAINSEQPMQAASMIKPLVMLAFFHEVERGRFIYGPTSKARLESMIRISSNSATNWVIDRIGGPAAVQGVLARHYGDVVPQARVVERIASNGRTYRNLASAADYARYLRALWHGRLPSAREQFRILNLPGRDRLYHGAPSIPAGTRVYNKTGSTARCCGDMGILAARKRAGGYQPWIVVGIIDRPTRATSYTHWISSRSNVIRAISDETYRFMAGRYALA